MVAEGAGGQGNVTQLQSCISGEAGAEQALWTPADEQGREGVPLRAHLGSPCPHQRLASEGATRSVPAQVGHVSPGRSPIRRRYILEISVKG